MKMPLTVKIVFIASLIYGIFLSSHTPFWNDEIWSQIRAIPTKSYTQLLKGQFGEYEGNKAPLFYVQQKLWEQIIGYHNPPDLWNYKQTWKERILLRLPTLIEMSLFLTVMFWFFKERFNIWMGFLALGLTITTHVITLHWPEARPYTIWICLTGIQFILFIKLLEFNPYPLNEQGFFNSIPLPPPIKTWWTLAIVQILLSLNCILSVFQIIVICGVLILNKPKWYWYIISFLIPLFFVNFYHQDGSLNATIFQNVPAIIMLKGSSLLALPLLGLWFFHRRGILLFGSICALYILQAIFLTYLYTHSNGTGAYIISRHIMNISIVEIIGAVYLIGLWIENNPLTK